MIHAITRGPTPQLVHSPGHVSRHDACAGAIRRESRASPMARDLLSSQVMVPLLSPDELAVVSGSGFGRAPTAEAELALLRAKVVAPAMKVISNLPWMYRGRYLNPADRFDPRVDPMTGGPYKKPVDGPHGRLLRDWQADW